VWWLDVATGATGRVTDDGASLSVDWRQQADDAGPDPDPTPAPARDLAVVALKPPKAVALKDGAAVTKPLLVQIQNRGAQPVVLPDRATLAALVTVDVQALGPGCAAPPAVLAPGKANKIPRTIKAKGKLNVAFTVSYACAVDGAKTTRKDPGHSDFRYVAAVHPANDDEPADDLCPRVASGTADEGCGARGAGGALGADVTTDVVVK
jgi:hypothetical protein